MLEDVVLRAEQFLKQQKDPTLINIVHNTSEELVFEKSKLNSANSVDQMDITIMIVHSGYIGKAMFKCGADISFDALKRAAENALRAKRKAYFEEFPNELPNQHVKTCDSKILNEDPMDFYDSAVQEIESLSEISPAVSASCGKDVIETHILNNEGLIHSNTATDLYFEAELSVPDKNPFNLYAGGAWGSYSDVDVHSVYDRIVKDYSLLKNPHAARSGKYTLVIDPELFHSILQNLFRPALNFNNYSTHKSFLSEKLNTQIFPDIFTLESNPFLDFRGHSALLDDYGSKTTRKFLFKNGVFTSYLSDLQSAGEFNGINTGNNFAGISFDNLIMPPGQLKTEDLLQDVTYGIYAKSALGVHTADYVSGTLSITIDSGWLINKGKYAGAVKNANISLNILDLFSKLYAVSKDHLKKYTYTLPTLFFQDVQIA